MTRQNVQIFSIIISAILLSTFFGVIFLSPESREDPDRAWTIEASGRNVEVIEFRPKTLPGKLCVFATRGSSSGALYCADAPNPNP